MQKQDIVERLLMKPVPDADGLLSEALREDAAAEIKRLRAEADKRAKMWTKYTDGLEAEIEQLKSALRQIADEIERLRAVVSNLTALLDLQMGTPCEQIRHQQEVEQLRTEIGCLHQSRAQIRAEMKEECARVAENSTRCATAADFAAAIRALE